jgi:hypothetical protein
MSIGDSYRAMAADIKLAAEAIDVEDIRRAYLALGNLWEKRSIELDQGRVASAARRAKEVTARSSEARGRQDRTDLRISNSPIDAGPVAKSERD